LGIGKRDERDERNERDERDESFPKLHYAQGSTLEPFQASFSLASPLYQGVGTLPV